MDNCWISCQVMADMKKKVYDDLISIKLYLANFFLPPSQYANLYAWFEILSLFSNLQEGVPDAIANLRLAGMIVWVLTGDKQETAINIAYSCKLFTKKMEIILLNAHSRDSAEQILTKNLEEIKHFNENIDESQHNESDNQGKKVILCTKKHSIIDRPACNLIWNI